MPVLVQGTQLSPPLSRSCAVSLPQHIQMRGEHNMKEERKGEVNTGEPVWNRTGSQVEQVW
ncbi:Hypothetical protein SMAX5B_022486 [Scophthalmus maximus]|uniref:Uncharacterized protein n=1 Tax=Scophthalmus maximus TaxID=52904 RepID=A0A2U9C3X9_SCOMX|nr:Hypothetical protein SMAX5B_022486 [Scophthalmus maximus]